jgi:hypothetical protein
MPPYSGHLVGRQRRAGTKSYLRQPVIMGVTLNGTKMQAASLRLLDGAAVLVCPAAPPLGATVTIVAHDARGRMVIVAGCVIDLLPTTDGRAWVGRLRIDCARTKGSRLHFKEVLTSCLGLRVSERDLISDDGLWGFQRVDASQPAIKLDELAEQRAKTPSMPVEARVRVNHRVAVHHQERFRSGLAVDICEEGLRLALDERLPVGADILVYYPVSLHAQTEKLILATTVEQILEAERKTGVWLHLVRIKSFSEADHGKIWREYNEVEARIGGSGRLKVVTGGHGNRAEVGERPLRSA